MIMFRGLDISGWGLEFWVPDSRFGVRWFANSGVWGSRVWGFEGLRVRGLDCRDWDLVFGVWRFGLEMWSLGLRVELGGFFSSYGYRVEGGFRV